MIDSHQSSTPPGITFHMLERGARGDNTLRERILGALKNAGLKAQSTLPAFNVDVVVFESPWAVIPRLGVNGNSFHPHKIEVIYDSAHPYFSAHVEAEIGAVLVHELHHHARGEKYGRSLGERFVAEGLACCFEEECGFETPFYAIECKGDALHGFASRALPVLDRKDLNFNNWMFGHFDKSDGEFPYQCGYSLGYALVKSWLMHTNSTASADHALDAEVVLTAWRTGTIQPKT